jgi:hypothetical protein
VTIRPGTNWRDRPCEAGQRAAREHQLFKLEKTMMNRIRPRQKRSLRFEALEGRLALSTGMGVGVVSHQAHVLVKSAAPRQVQVPVSFKGQVSVSGSTVTTTNLTGKIGRDHFTGHGTGTISGKIFQGGNVYLSNSNGSVFLKLSTQAGKGTRQTIAFVALEATGKYAPYAGKTGTLTTWNIPARPNATATFSGVFTLT